MNKGIKYIFAGLIAVGTVAGSYAANIAVAINAVDVTGVSLAGGGTPVPTGDFMQIGTYTVAPTVGVFSLANFVPYASGQYMGSGGLGDGFFSTNVVANELSPAHQQIYLIAYNNATGVVVPGVTQAAIWTTTQANWKFPASGDIPNNTSLDIEQMLNNPGANTATVKADSKIVFGQNPFFVANDPNDSNVNTTWLPLQTIPAVPEPSSLVLVGLGILGGLGVIRRRKS